MSDYKSQRVIAFIPVRGGSKSIPMKNIKLMAGKPLVWYAVEAARKADYITDVIVSTDSEHIQEVIETHFGKSDKVHCYRRSKETATDTASTESAMLEYARFDPAFEHFILIQATSPLLTSEDLNMGFKLYTEKKLGGLLSVTEQKRFIWKQSNPENYDPLQRPRRQEMEGYQVENGAFYITNRERLLKSECRISPPYGTYVMTEDSYFEIDEPSDWLVAEQLLMKRMQSEKAGLFKIMPKAIIFDFDGVFTDNKVLVMQNGEEAVLCDRGDGMGIELLRKAGIDMWVLSKEQNPVLKSRCEKLKLPCLHGVDNKLELLKQQLSDRGLRPTDIIYVGNDINDVDCIKYARTGVVVADAYPEARSNADYILKSKGGNGAIRELADMILNKNIS